MSTEIPGLPESELNGDDDAVFDELARRAGAALRRPAPEDGVSVIAHRRRRQQALKATVVGGVAVATLIGALVVVSTRDDPDGLRPVDSLAGDAPSDHDPSANADCVASRSIRCPKRSQPPRRPRHPRFRPHHRRPLPSNRCGWNSSRARPHRYLRADPRPQRPALVWTGTEVIVWGGFADDGTPEEPPLPARRCGVRPGRRDVATDRPAARRGQARRGAVDRHRDARVERRDSRHAERRLRPGDRHMAVDRRPTRPRGGGHVDR